jgi:hypothetical protein
MSRLTIDMIQLPSIQMYYLEQLKVFGQSEHQKVKNHTASTINKEKWLKSGHFWYMVASVSCVNINYLLEVLRLWSEWASKFKFRTFFELLTKSSVAKL